MQMEWSTPGTGNSSNQRHPPLLTGMYTCMRYHILFAFEYFPTQRARESLPTNVNCLLVPQQVSFGGKAFATRVALELIRSASGTSRW